jgi:lipid II:glycine glycyltransferase (peptidoglycan interpeptide bridge formation enzyme)
MTDEERRALYDNVYSKLLTLLERCQKYVHHLNNKVKQSLAEHQQSKKIKKELDEQQSTSTEDDIKRTGLLKKYYEMTDKDIQARQPKFFVGALKPC